MTTMLQDRITENRFDLYSRGMKALQSILGTVDTEEFISFVKSDQFDYTEWQRGPRSGLSLCGKEDETDQK